MRNKFAGLLLQELHNLHLLVNRVMIAAPDIGGAYTDMIMQSAGYYEPIQLTQREINAIMRVFWPRRIVLSGFYTAYVTLFAPETGLRSKFAYAWMRLVFVALLLTIASVWTGKDNGKDLTLFTYVTRVVMGDLMRIERISIMSSFVGSMLSLMADSLKQRRLSNQLMAQLREWEVACPECAGQCPICRNDMIPNSEPIARTPCEHHYHIACLALWFNEQKTCPTCRTRFDFKLKTDHPNQIDE
jgi:hypothetical protein